jgi:hypothetical protein
MAGPARVPISRRPPKPSAIFDTYWRFAALRQDIFHRRVRGESQPWTDDPVLLAHRFTNAYRASDRVSQYLIHQVAYNGDQAPNEVVFRVLLFKLFNKIATWELLTDAFGTPSADDFSVEKYDQVLTQAFERGERVYSAAYIMPAAQRGVRRKHLTHLRLLRQMLDDHLAERLVACRTMRGGFEALVGYRGLGSFLAYQLITDLNYTAVLDYSEMEYVVPGPGAASGIRKCFDDPGDYSDADLIRFVTERQGEEFERRALAFQDLWGRPLQLVDCQNLFCEVDKYSRVVHPDVQGIGNRSRIKQRFTPAADPVDVWFPPKWGINDRINADEVRRQARWSEHEDRLLIDPVPVP